MDETQPNPLAAHLLGAVETRQQLEVAKLALLTQLVGLLENIGQHVSALEDQVVELNERLKAR